MKLLLYNVCYCMGVGKGIKDYVTKNAHLHLRKKALENISTFIKKQSPDIVCLVEIDDGSFRAGKIDQAEFIKETLDFKSMACFCKYGKKSALSKLPYFHHLCNSVMSKYKFSSIKEHFLKRGNKKLVIEVEIDHGKGKLSIFLVHLALGKRARRKQIKEIAKFVNSNNNPKIVLGDFNTLSGEEEINLFVEETDLMVAQHKGKTFPAWKPKKSLDYVLFSKEIKIKKTIVPKVKFSDHLPMIVEFDIQ
ncbi:endonuclease [Candidatus Woesearchaeota archaeon]|jgi:endonuclease/exonuclease/phosphatase family metal-dependent hydrolase|nr:endonuclease [Candidatus Woesearchaeota archaeon]MBT5271868.1 endonuclease [Candidatus Woesearchaeota archaeon]MBT6041668.1 endonuclease [Candidatus Woesearchaeota archaeon]MBT6337356.1 endonuclease [Candidatus Woesearchaeota archaeon]MBT7927604.1 endonuclease [Candidatus Woesearchaeota archaeon]